MKIRDEILKKYVIVLLEISKIDIQEDVVERITIKIKPNKHYNITECVGLCGNVFQPMYAEMSNNNIPYIAMPDVEPIWKSWEHFSGSNRYPIPANENNDECPIKQFAKQGNQFDNSWYGTKRKELAKHAAKYLIEKYNLDIENT